MEEFATVLRARQFVKLAGGVAVPVDIERLAAAAGASVRMAYDLANDESGQTFMLKGKHVIAVNGNHTEVRQRFTALHEVAHIVLGVSSDHHENGLTVARLMRYGRRPPEEIICDVFAAECLLPYGRFLDDVGSTEMSMKAVKGLAERYKASLTSTGSRFAAATREPCAFVLSESGVVRYVSRSRSLADLGGWVDFNGRVPRGSVAERLFGDGSVDEGSDALVTDIWFDRAISRRNVIEEAVALREWDQCLSLLWLEKDHDDDSDEDDALLEELDGTLSWPSKRRRR